MRPDPGRKPANEEQDNEKDYGSQEIEGYLTTGEALSLEQVDPPLQSLCHQEAD